MREINDLLRRVVDGQIIVVPEPINGKFVLPSPRVSVVGVGIYVVAKFLELRDQLRQSGERPTEFAAFKRNVVRLQRFVGRFQAERELLRERRQNVLKRLRNRTLQLFFDAFDFGVRRRGALFEFENLDAGVVMRQIDDGFKQTFQGRI